MKINARYISENTNQEFKVTVHIENRVITAITSRDVDEFRSELQKLQPSFFGSKKIVLSESINSNYKYSLFYTSKLGQKKLFLNFSKLQFLLTKISLDFSHKFFIQNFIIYSFLSALSFPLFIFEQEEVSFYEILLLFSFVISTLIMWNLNSKLEKSEEKIMILKKMKNK